MKVASYRHAVVHIALNDDPANEDVEEVKGTLTVGVIADIFDVPTEKVAEDIVKFRKKENKRGPRND